ncbi:hypothetical protein POAN111098_10045 [Polynucleobacter antarcticus]
MPVKVLPLTVKVTVSPNLASPPTMPVIAILVAASAALITSLGVMFSSKVMVGTESSGGSGGASSGLTIGAGVVSLIVVSGAACPGAA